MPCAAGGRLALLCALLAGVGAAIRPISYLQVGAVVVLVLLREREHWRGAMLVALGCILVWVGVVGGEKGYSRWRHGDQMTSLTGLHLYAKGALLDVPPVDRAGLNDEERQLADAAETRYQPVRDLLQRTRGSVAHQALLAYYEICIQRDCTKRLRDRSHLSEAAYNDAMRHVGWLRVEQDPGGFLALAGGGILVHVGAGNPHLSTERQAVRCLHRFLAAAAARRRGERVAGGADHAQRRDAADPPRLYGGGRADGGDGAGVRVAARLEAAA